MKVLNKKFKSFTLIELIIVIAIVWVLMMATTVYLWGTDEKRKVIEAQWCAASIWGEMTNFVFYTLTSKNLRYNDKPVSPTYYIVSLTWSSTSHNCTRDHTWSLCNTIVFSFLTWNTFNINKSVIYETKTPWDICHWLNSNIKFLRSWSTNNNISYAKMNKWFTENEENTSDHNVFTLGPTQQFVWDIVTVLCLNSDCSTPKEISRFVVDWRSQTISTKNCKFYEANDANKCKTREDCQIYDPNDWTVCLEY